MGNCFKNFKIEEYIKMKPEGLCTLCGQKDNCSAVQEANQLETLSFLKSNPEISEAQLCPKCQEKVQLISGIKQETKCYLCGLQGNLKLVKDRHQLQTLSFLKNSDEITEAKLCLKCQEKVQFRQRCEVALGYFRPGMAEPIINPGSETSDGSSITPDKSVRITWRSGDQIVVIAED